MRSSAAVSEPPAIAGVRRTDRLDEQHVGLEIRARAVLHAARHDQHLTLFEDHVAIPQLNRQAPVEDQEEVVGVVVLVPHELASRLDERDLVVVQLADDLRTEGLVERRELLG